MKVKIGFKKTCSVNAKTADYSFNVKSDFNFWCENTTTYCTVDTCFYNFFFVFLLII